MNEALIAERYNNGATVRGLAKEYDCDRDVIKRILREHTLVIRNANPEISERQRATIRTLYSENVPMAVISSRVGVGGWAVKQTVRRAGLTRAKLVRPRYKCPANDVLVAMFNSGMTSSQIAEEVGISPNLVLRRISPLVRARTRSESIRMGRSEWTAISPLFSLFPLTPEKAWFLGLVFGDGHVRSRRDEVSIGLTVADCDILDKVNAALFEGKCAVSRCQGNVATLAMASQVLAGTLRDAYGTSGKKALTLRWPYLPKSMARHFVRGLLDTDGCWSAGRKLQFAYVSASSGFVADLRNVLIKHVGVSSGANMHTRTTKPSLIKTGQLVAASRISSISYGHKDSVAIGQWLYAGSTEHMRGERKYRKWVELAHSSLHPQSPVLTHSSLTNASTAK